MYYGFPQNNVILVDWPYAIGSGLLVPPVISGDVTDPTAIGCQECEEGIM